MVSLVGVVTAVTWLSVGAVVSRTNVFTFKAVLALPTESVTVIVQLLYVPSARALKVIALLPAEAEELELLQLPPYVMDPASFVDIKFEGSNTLITEIGKIKINEPINTTDGNWKLLMSPINQSKKLDYH